MGSDFILFPGSYPVRARRDFRGDLVPFLLLCITDGEAETQRQEVTGLRTHWKIPRPRAFSVIFSDLYSIYSCFLILRRQKCFRVSWTYSECQLFIQWIGDPMGGKLMRCKERGRSTNTAEWAEMSKHNSRSH